MKEKKARVEDALNATRAAVEEGIVPGGGVALLKAGAVLNDYKLGTIELQAGVTIIKRICEEPIRQIASNSGFDGAVVVDKLSSNKDANFGFNAATETFEDMLKAGVIDPVKVTRSALQNAASVAGLLLTTECMIAEAPKKDAPSAPAPDMGGMGGMGGMGF
jgi:chaperonin GroEL